MGKEILTFGDIKIEKNKLLLSQKSYFLKRCRY